ncbi:hypothetical protein [Oceanobacillus jeddahense]|uniref:hypothetical protein n=1 Tax=Oceanobacillus jeddahense TaxID=1462527 RepID=UPI00362717D3
MNCEYEGATFGEADKKPKEVITCPFCLGSYVDKFHYAKYKQKLPTGKRENKLKRFDVQRVESLMRYAEFLTAMNGAGVGDKGDKINRVIDLIHYEVGGYVDPIDEVVTAYADDEEVAKCGSLHPDVKEFISQEIKRQSTVHIDAEQISKAIRRGME